MKNKKILAAWISCLLLAWSLAPVSAWFHHNWYANTKSTQKVELTDEQKALMESHRAIKDKLRNWETLTSAEEATLAEMKNTMWTWIWAGMGKWKWMWSWTWIQKLNILTDEERTAYNNMTDTEKQTFLQTKRDEQKTRMDSHQAVIDKILKGETLTSEEEAIKKEIIEYRANKKARFNINN